MGDQTLYQIETETLTESQPLLLPYSTTNAAIASVATLTELTDVTPQPSSPPSKIPFRPRKIQKICREDSSDGKVSNNGAGKSKASTSRNNKNKTVQRVAPVPRIVARSLSCEGEIEIALRYLRDADPLFAPLIDMHQPPTFDTFLCPFVALTKSILHQQLAVKAGTSIYNRFINLCGGEGGVLPETVLALSPHELRQIGVSGRKASYLHDLAKKYQNGILSDSAIVNMDDKSLFTMLTMVNGIGSWSVHMFMIFSLHRPDVLPINDLQVRKGLQLLHNLEELPRPSQMDQLCEKWRPYRSVAACYLWRFVESKGTPSAAAAMVNASLQHHQHQHQLQEEHHHQPQHHQQQPQHHQQQPQHHQQQPPHHQHQPQLLESINSILNIGACNWGQ